ncbi:hypothetical protein ACG2OD_14475 [Streptomyces sp. PDY-4]|uniref:hypothetical protein n=1 Tax=Streptomyces sp. PDY-4 TaxID=3376070 RepID=UPI00378CA25A
MNYAQIAAKYGVSRQAVTKRFNDMGEFRRGEVKTVTAVLPWDVANHPAKAKLANQTAFLGLRAYLRLRLGEKLSARSQTALRIFLQHIEAGEVLELDSVQGARYVERDPETDGSLVIRWPEGVPLDGRSEYFRIDPGQGFSAAS